VSPVHPLLTTSGDTRYPQTPTATPRSGNDQTIRLARCLGGHRGKAGPTDYRSFDGRQRVMRASMSTTRWLDDDDELMAELGRVVADDLQVPARIIDAAKACFAWRTIDADLAILTGSSAGMADGLAEVRGDVPGPRLFCFEQGDVGVEIEVSSSTVRGQLYPSRTGLITVLTPTGPFAETRTDEMGCFSAPWPASGPARIRCDTKDSNFVTDWLLA
jgi:hypothetical protein